MIPRHVRNARLYYAFLCNGADELMAFTMAQAACDQLEALEQNDREVAEALEQIAALPEVTP